MEEISTDFAREMDKVLLCLEEALHTARVEPTRLDAVLRALRIIRCATEIASFERAASFSRAFEIVVAQCLSGRCHLDEHLWECFCEGHDGIAMLTQAELSRASLSLAENRRIHALWSYFRQLAAHQRAA